MLINKVMAVLVSIPFVLSISYQDLALYMEIVFENRNSRYHPIRVI